MSGNVNYESIIQEINESYNIFATLLKGSIKNSGIRQQDLALAMYVEPSTISQWKTGRRMPSIDVIVPIGKHLNLSTEQILDLREAWNITNQIRSDLEFIRECLRDDCFEIADILVKDMQQNISGLKID